MKIGLIAAEFTKISAAVALGSGILWKLYLEERVGQVVAESEARMIHRMVAVSIALAEGDSLGVVRLTEFMKHPPAGPGF